LHSVLDANNEPELYAKIQFCIKDMENSKIITRSIHDIAPENIQFKSAKYKAIDTTKLDKNICSYHKRDRIPKNIERSLLKLWHTMIFANGRNGDSLLIFVQHQGRYHHNILGKNSNYDSKIIRN
jgi:hypothetical protein